MTNDTYQTNNSDPKSTPFGALLKSTREAKGLERKEVASQLRLNENVITMLESDNYTTDLPATFVRGYIRSYGKLLQIPDHEIAKALEPINPNPIYREGPPIALRPDTVTSSNYFVQFFTYLIVLTMMGLVGTWWYTHNSSPSETPQTVTTTVTNSAITPPLATTSNPTLPPTISSVPITATNNAGNALQVNDMGHPTTQTAPPSHADQVGTTNKPVANTNKATNKNADDNSDNADNSTDTTDDAQ